MKNQKSIIVGVAILVVILVLVSVFTKINVKNKNSLTGAVALPFVNNMAATNPSIVVDDGTPLMPQIEVPLITKKLKLFSIGSEVEILQQALNDAGYSVGRVDKIFGAKTRSSLRNFQADYGLPLTGSIDEPTRAVINNLITKKANEKYQEELKKEEEKKAEEARNEQLRQEQEKKNEELKQQEQEKQQQEKQEQEKEQQQQKEEEQQKQQKQQETISFLDTKNKNILYRDYSCKEENNEKLSVFTGEYIDETKNSIGRLSDVWSTWDGIKWKQESTKIKIGEGWERMIVKVGDTVYSFGGKYQPSSSKSDNAIYKSTDMVNWTYVGDIPEMNHEYDRSVVYFKDKFWLIGSEEGKNGVWSSSTGEKWTQVLTKTPWDGAGMDRVYNAKGRYDSNSLGAYVINDKMWYLVYNNQKNAGYPDYAIMRLYSTKDGTNWTDEGYLINKDDNSYFNIASNANPFPVTMDGKVWIVSYSRKTDQPMVINTSNGKDWSLVSTNQTNLITNSRSYYLPHNYSSLAVFKNKLWVIGGWDQKGNTNSNDNGEDIWSSSDGVTWTNMPPKGVTFPGPADRWLAGIMAIGKSSPKAANLEIEREYNASGFFTGQDENQRTLGKWKVIANEGKDNTGDVVISNLSFVGTDYKTSDEKQFSSLESLENITIYADSVKVGEIKSFKGPFYDSTGEYALSQTITLDKEITLKKGESVWIAITADFPVPKYKNFEMRTWLNGIGFKDEYSTPCNVSTQETADSEFKSPGRNIYFKDR